MADDDLLGDATPAECRRVAQEYRAVLDRLRGRHGREPTTAEVIAGLRERANELERGQSQKTR